MSIQVITPPSTEPLSLAEAKVHLKVDADATDEDSLISSLITGARELLETLTSRAIAQQTIRQYFDQFPDHSTRWLIQLNRPPVRSLTSVKYLDTNGVEQTIPLGDVLIDRVSEPARVRPGATRGWPCAGPQMNAVYIDYQSGYTTPPESVKQFIRLMVGHWFENREAAAIGMTVAELPLAAQTLVTSLQWGQYR